MLFRSIKHFGGLYPEGMPLYDNFNSVLQTGFSNKHNVSVEAGSDKTTLKARASYLNQTGVIKTTDYSRFNLSLSGKAEITSWLKFEGSMQYSSTQNTKVPRGVDGPLFLAMKWKTTVALYAIAKAQKMGGVGREIGRASCRERV